MDNDSLGTQTPMCNSLSSAEPSLDQVSEPPPLCHLDLGVIESLPPELFTELNGVYGGKLVDYVAKNKQENTSATVPHEQIHVLFCQFFIYSASIFHQNYVKVTFFAGLSGGCHVEVSTSGPGNTDTMMLSLSQVDTSMLQQLPQELRIDILGQLPAHRTNDTSSSASLGTPQKSLRNY